MPDLRIDNGQSFDFGRTASEYAKYRDIYPKELYERLSALGVGKAGSFWLDLGTGTGVVPRGLADQGAQIIGVDVSGDQIEQARKLSAGFENVTYIVSPVEDLEFPEDSFDAITACQCFWYFDPKIIVDKIRRFIKPNGLFLKLYMSYLKDDPVARQSHALVRQLNSNWVGGSPALQDLRTHYFEDPQTDSFFVDLPFTREGWHGRIKTCRGVLASMDGETFKKFEEAHLEMLEHLPERFTVKHKVFLTWYRIKKCHRDGSVDTSLSVTHNVSTEPSP